MTDDSWGRDDLRVSAQRPQLDDELRPRWVDEPLMRVEEQAPDRDPKRRRGEWAMIGALVIAGAAVVAFVVSVTSDDEDEAERPPVTVAATLPDPDPQVGAEPASEPSLETLPSATASTLSFPGGDLPISRYATDLLDVPIEFDVAHDTALRTARPGHLVLTPLGSAVIDVGGELHAQFLRVGGWSSPDEAVDLLHLDVGSIAPGDVDRWIVENDVVIDDVTGTTVDGHRATRYDLRVDPESPLGHGVCLPQDRPCFWFVTVPEEHLPDSTVRRDIPLYGAMAVRMWLIDLGDDHPLLIEAAAPEGAERWLDLFESATIASMDIGA